MLAGGEARLLYRMAPVRPPWRQAGGDARHHHSPGPRFLAKPHRAARIAHDSFDTADAAVTPLTGTRTSSRAVQLIRRVRNSVRRLRPRGAVVLWKLPLRGTTHMD